ncbi:MAG: TauD/TfdA family dioxygenase, partial [Burkholderiaceae bacterium]|nr:TauD/TfdA family dioxygenase [Burkholderiaceae bacterium]
MRTSQAINAVGSIPKAIDGPCAWRGSDLAQKSDWIVHWTSAQVAELERAADHFSGTGIALENITPESFPLQNLSSLIGGQLQELLHGRGFVMLRGLPIANWSIEKAAT